MSLPSWFTYNLGGRSAGIFTGIGTAFATLWFLKRTFPYANTRFKNKSALYGGRKVPDGEDPWEY